MTDAAATPASTNRQNRIDATLLGIVVALATINSIILLAWPENESDAALAFYFGYMICQPVLFGVWTALHTGSMFTRLPIAVASLILLWVTPGILPANFEKFEKYELLSIGVAELALYLIALILFLIFRRISGFRLRSESEETAPPAQPFQFSTRYILCLMTICAMDLGMAFNLTFQSPPDPGTTIVGPKFFMEIWFFGAAILGVAILPTMAVPLFILQGRPSQRAIIGSLLFWAVVLSSPVVLFIDQSGPGESFLILFLVQLASTIVGAIIAIALRLAGLRLVRPPRQPHSQPLAPDEPLRYTRPS